MEDKESAAALARLAELGNASAEQRARENAAVLQRATALRQAQQQAHAKVDDHEGVAAGSHICGPGWAERDWEAVPPPHLGRERDKRERAPLLMPSREREPSCSC